MLGLRQFDATFARIGPRIRLLEQPGLNCALNDATGKLLIVGFAAAQDTFDNQP
ncbi:hypothetical protein LB543_22740 [Mesorhizobium sp. ESP7-2]|uniref:hypothetical protein n=1 Tax=Mesorhizobium sp. ESP7-2 TaxID=2876622 RepID=UPI001CCF0CE8|nr:hypothetical protein [Mesorhizobium sp. ESP7-2]MBZ9709534.1 hypothetical protein [Mesorhizobium sp. ESP7-2]